MSFKILNRILFCEILIFVKNLILSILTILLFRYFYFCFDDSKL